MATSILATANTTGTSETDLLAAQGPGKAINITHLSFSNTDTTNACNVSLKFGGTTKWDGIVVPAGLAHNFHFDPPVRLDSNTKVSFQSDTSATTLYANMAYFIHPNG